jgi:hypothetical protein
MERVPPIAMLALLPLMLPGESTKALLRPE